MFHRLYRLLLASVATIAIYSSAHAQQLTKATIVQMHPVIGPGEDIFLYAIPKQLGYFKAEGLEVSIQGAQSGVVSAQVIQSGGAQIGTTAPESVLQMREQGGDLIAFWQIKQNGGIETRLFDCPIHRFEYIAQSPLAVDDVGLREADAQCVLHRRAV